MFNEHTLPPRSGGKARHVVILLHGVGDSGAGLIDLGEFWRKDLPEVEFIAPDAPFPFDGAPFGRQWFSLQDRSPAAILKGVQQSASLLDAFLDHVLTSRNLPAGRLALVGFSQGTMMSLYVGPRRSESLAGVIGYSGRLAGGESLPLAQASSPSFLLIHGQQDEVVDFAELAKAEQGLRRAGYKVDSMARPHLGHSIDKAGLDAGLNFLSQVLA